MPKIDFGPFITSIVIALVFFAIGRYFAIQLDDAGRWAIYIGLIVFYAIWWFFYQRRKGKK
jgi:hypothetical protein